MSLRPFDIAIVGAGPAGSAAAISLARRGYAVALLDKTFFPREKLCGDFLNPANWPLLECLGVADKILSLPHEKITGFRISAATGEEAAIDFALHNGRRSFGLGLRRFHLDELLLKTAAKEGVVVRQGCKVSGLTRGPAGWSISLGDLSDGSKLQALLLIGADGRNSPVAHRLGLAGKRERSGNYLAFQAHMRAVRRLQGDVQIHSFPQGYAGLVSVGGGAANLCFVVKKEQAGGNTSFEALREGCLYQNPFLRESLTGSEIAGPLRSAFPVYFSPRRSHGDGFLLVGDAARVTEPVTGAGIYFALKSGLLAARAAHRALSRRNLSADSLSVYERWCRDSFRLRRGINALARALIYRPFLLAPMLRLSARSSFPLRSLVARACADGDVVDRA